MRDANLTSARDVVSQTLEKLLGIADQIENTKTRMLYLRAAGHIAEAIDVLHSVTESQGNPPNNPGPRGTLHTQSILFDRGKWTPIKARKWLKEHKKRYGKLEVKEGFLHFRQRDPSRFDSSSFKTVTIGDESDGVKMVMGHYRVVPQA